EGTLTVTVRGQAAVRHNFAGAGGGGIYLADGASLDMQGGAIQANTTTGWGGGLALEQGEAALLEAVVSANEALDGGGIALAGDPDNFVDATNTQIISNTASLNGGGVHTVLANVVLYDTNGSSRLSGNQSGGDGGAVWNQGATV